MAAVFLLPACQSLNTAGAKPEQAAASAQQPAGWQWRKLGSKDYEPQVAGLGQSFHYESQAGWADVFRYSMNRGEWKEGRSDPGFAAHFKQAMSDIAKTAQQGAYSKLQLFSVVDVTIDGQDFRHATFTYEARGRSIESHLLLTARNGKLLKYRISIFQPVPEDLATGLDRFVVDSMQEVLPRDKGRPGI